MDILVSFFTAFPLSSSNNTMPRSVIIIMIIIIIIITIFIECTNSSKLESEALV